MKAIHFFNHGGPEVLEYGKIGTPEPAHNEVLVSLKAAALNHLDIWVREGWPGINLSYPHIPGADGAGVVETVGEGISDWIPGDKVVINSNIGCGTCSYCLAGDDNLCRNWNLLGETLPGTYAANIVVPSRQLLHIPPEIEFQEAAAAGLVFQTAWHSLITRGNLKPGERVLIIGASGGVNSASIQVAKYAGADVYVVGSNKEKLEFAESLGADTLIDRSRNKNWSQEIYRMTNRKGVDVVVDNVGTTFPQSFRAVSKGGRILTVGNTGGAIFEIDNRYIFGKQLTIIGSTMGTIADFSTVMGLVFQGKLKVAIDSTYSLKDARSAQTRLENNDQLGKITLTID